jgi:predicted phosphodiesterase
VIPFRRVAALYDIHGNLPALDAVLAEVARERVDLIVVGGDVFPGPMAVESLQMLLSLQTPVTFIRGNGDRETLAARHGSATPTLPPPVQVVLRWCGSTVADPLADRMRDWPLTFTCSIAGLGAVLFCHATPHDDTTIITSRTAEVEVTRHLAGIEEQTIVCGHTHMQYERSIGATRLLNAGSVGMPFGAAGADWLLLGPDVVMRHTDYDLAAAADRVRQSGYPDAESFAAANILAPPTAATMLDRFTPVA